jgi:hypothetical protein
MRLLAIALGAVALASGVPPKWHTFRGDAISVRYPPTWTATSHPLTPVSSPTQFLAVASYPLPDGSAGADGCRPTEALRDMPASGAFIYGWEYGTPARSGLRVRAFARRPRHFRLTGFAHYECLGPSYMLRFRQAGRFFQIHVAFGSRATATTRRLVLRVLDSLRVEKL